jgi:outer membrane protein TolC
VRRRRAPTTSLGANASYTIFDGFRREAQLRSARAQDREADAGLDYERSQNALRTTNTFLGALQATELLRVAAERIQRADEQFKIAVAKLSTRAATVADSLQAAAQLGQARLAHLSQQSQLANTEAQLARAVGMHGRVAAIEDSALYSVVAIADTAALFAEALGRSPQVLRAEAVVDRQSALVTSARSTYMPSLSLSANSSFSGSNRNDYQLFNNRSLTLGVQWPLFNGFQRELNVARERAALDTERARADDTRREVGSRLEAQLAALRTAEERVTLSQEILATTRANLQVQLERYRLGSIDITQLNQAQQQLNQAESDAVTARFDYVRAKAEIEAIVGRQM